MQTDQYNTRLTPQEEREFQTWARSVHRERDVEDYDLRGAWKAGIRGGANGHFPDTYKKPNHPTFSNESIYSKGFDAGRWTRSGGRDVFIPGQQNLRSRSREDLQRYFRENEPGVELRLPVEIRSREMQTRDPLLDLPLTFIGESPPIRAQQAPTSVLPPPSPVIPQGSQGGSAGTGNSSRAPDPEGLGHTGVLDSVIFALTGTPDALLTPEDAKARAGRRKEASEMAVQASLDPGEGDMWAPVAGGSGFGLNDILGLLKTGAKMAAAGGGGG